jgi:hypothetical protein
MRPGFYRGGARNSEIPTGYEPHPPSKSPITQPPLRVARASAWRGRPTPRATRPAKNLDVGQNPAELAPKAFKTVAWKLGVGGCGGFGGAPSPRGFGGASPRGFGGGGGAPSPGRLLSTPRSTRSSLQQNMRTASGRMPDPAPEKLSPPSPRSQVICL